MRYPFSLVCQEQSTSYGVSKEGRDMSSDDGDTVITITVGIEVYKYLYPREMREFDLM